MNPRISVTICAYNAQDHLAETVDSVLAQTLGDFELVIVDDGSRDGTGEIGRAYAARDERVRYHFQPNAGFGAARNKCLELARAEWIAIIDHDDLCLPDRLEAQLDAARAHPAADLIFSDSEHFRDDGSVVRRQFSEFNPCALDLRAGLAAEQLLIHGCFIDSETAFFRKSAALAAGGFQARWRYINDFEFFLRLGRLSGFHGVDRVLARWRVHSKQLTQTAQETSVAEHLELYRTWLADPAIGPDARRMTRLRLLGHLARAARYPALRAKLGGAAALASQALALRPASAEDYLWCLARLRQKLAAR